MPDKKKNDGGSAFPYHGEYSSEFQGGMSLRDWYAGMALQGLLAYAPYGYEDEYARRAYFHADAMLAAREGK